MTTNQSPQVRVADPGHRRRRPRRAPAPRDPGRGLRRFDGRHRLGIRAERRPQLDLAVAVDASQSTILWIINIYTLSLAALLLPLGAIGDRWGRKPMLLVGLTVFGVASR